MNTGKTLFAQIMDFLPWSTFRPDLPGEFGSANRTAVISSRYRSLHMSHIPVFARARVTCAKIPQPPVYNNSAAAISPASGSLAVVAPMVRGAVNGRVLIALASSRFQSIFHSRL